MIRILASVLALATGVATAAGPARPPQHPSACLAPGQWFLPAGGSSTPIAQPALLKDLSGKRVVLLGEQHDLADHHRWQLQVISALHAQRPNMVIAMEMFPRRAQPVLDQWVAGELSEEEFLQRSDWVHVWGFDPDLYLPILHFARLNRVPLVALNLDSKVVRETGTRGVAPVPADEREGVGKPAAAPLEYRKELELVFKDHVDVKGDSAADLERFIEAQLLWDRAFAEGVAAAAKRPGAPLVVGIIGSGHLRFGHGVPHQLSDLGLTDNAVLLPLHAEAECGEVPAGLAQAVFAVAAIPAPASRPRLGIRLETGAEGVRITEVTAGSVADQAGLKSGDIVREIASRPVRNRQDVTAAVLRQAPGTWLPVSVARNGSQLDLVAKFPPRL